MSVVVLGLALVVASARIAGTYGVLSETYDEGAHIACGMELLERGKYTYDPQHPPLARLAAAFGPWLSGRRGHGMANFWEEGRAILHDRDVTRTLTLARLGMLPFLILATIALWAWTRRLFGNAEAALAAALFTATPLTLAHAGLATTDVPFLGAFIALLVVSTLWLEQPTWRRGSLLGLVGALALTTKMSSLPFFGLTILLVVAVKRWWGEPGTQSASRWPLDAGHARTLLAALPVAFLTVWTIYGFQHGTLKGVPFPLTTYLLGLQELLRHNRLGHTSFLLGSTYLEGHPLFFLVGLAVKTPLTLLALGLAGAALLARKAMESRDWRLAVPLLSAVAVLAVSIPTRINIGVRHVLPVSAVLAMGAGLAGVHAWRRAGRAGRLALVILGLAGGWSTIRIHPDYLAYFNELGGLHPERILVDSDLDWGQDLLRLRDELRARRIDRVTVAYFGSALPADYGIPVSREWDQGVPIQGWFAVSKTFLARGYTLNKNGQLTHDPGAFAVLEGRDPVARVGKSILLYHVP